MMDLYGVVLAGGKSRRMGRDKAFLSYDGNQSQVVRVADLLRGFCADVEVSCREEQKATWESLSGLALRADKYAEMGPLGGILTALEYCPHRAVLVVACDLPFLDAKTLDSLVSARQPKLWATAFLGENGLPEPLCAIYEPSALDELRAYVLESGRTSPRDALRRGGVALIAWDDLQTLTNVNDPDEFKRALRRLSPTELS